MRKRLHTIFLITETFAKLPRGLRKIQKEWSRRNRLRGSQRSVRHEGLRTRNARRG